MAKHAGGRPTKYKPEYCLTVEYMAATGMTDVEMADNCVHRGKPECNKTCLEYNNCKPWIRGKR